MCSFLSFEALKGGERLESAAPAEPTTVDDLKITLLSLAYAL